MSSKLEEVEALLAKAKAMKDPRLHVRISALERVKERSTANSPQYRSLARAMEVIASEDKATTVAPSAEPSDAKAETPAEDAPAETHADTRDRRGEEDAKDPRDKRAEDRKHDEDKADGDDDSSDGDSRSERSRSHGKSVKDAIASKYYIYIRQYGYMYRSNFDNYKKDFATPDECAEYFAERDAGKLDA